MNQNFSALSGYMDEAGDGNGGGGGGETWLDSIAEEFRGDDALKPHADLNSLVKDYLGKSRMLGSRIPIPDKDSDDATRTEFNTKLAGVPGIAMIPGADDADAWGKFYNKLGRPETPEEYGFGKPDNLPEGVIFKEEAFKPFLKFMHDLGLSTTQARKAIEYRMTEAGNEAKALKTVGEASAANLKGEWGAAHEQNMGIGKTAAALFNEEDAATLGELAQTTPAVARALHKLGTLTLEDSVLKQFGAGGEVIRTPEEIRADLSALEGNKAYVNAQDPEHDGIMAKVSKLQQELSKAMGTAA